MRIKFKRNFPFLNYPGISSAFILLLLLAISLTLAACAEATPTNSSVGVAQPTSARTTLAAAISPPVVITTNAPTATVVPTTAAPADLQTPTSAPARAVTSPAPATRTPAQAIHQILDLTFINTMQGWVIGSYCNSPGKDCRVAIRMTTDGGRTWQAKAAPPVEPSFFKESSNYHKVGYLHFANAQDGWAFGSSFFSTHDGGTSWQAENRPEEIIAVESVDKTVYAATRTCSQPYACSIGLLVSTDTGHSWRNLASLPHLSGPAVQMVALTAQDVWLLSWGTPYSPPGDSNSGPAPTNLVVTHDGGQSWQALTNPCMEKGWLEARLAAANPQQFWLLCGTQPGAGQQIKYLYQSGDGGQNWKEVKAKMGGSGYVNSLAVSAPGKLWLALTRGTLIGSSDGGLTWKAAIPHEVANPGDGGVGPVVFADSNHGWLAAAQGKVFFTVDGGASWQPVDLP
jgi:photosystem II stability/assembly factor-like uncharacterized protein